MYQSYSFSEQDGGNTEDDSGSKVRSIDCVVSTDLNGRVGALCPSTQPSASSFSLGGTTKETIFFGNLG